MNIVAKLCWFYYYDFKYYFWTPLKQDKIQFLKHYAIILATGKDTRKLFSYIFYFVSVQMCQNESSFAGQTIPLHPQ